MKVFGIDVSTWQGNFDFKSAANNDGVKFAILRGAYSAPAVLGSSGGMDGRYQEYYNNAKEAKLDVGCYQYSMATTVEQAKAEAAFMCDSVLKGHKFELPIYIDIEDNIHKTLGKRKLTDIAHAWCQYMESHGYFAGIYASLSWFDSMFYDSELQRYAHWVAQWSADCTYKGNTGVLGMWQFGGSTNVIRSTQIAGVTCDQDYMFIDYPAQIKSIGLNGYTKSTASPKPETPKKKTNEEVADAVIRGEYGNNPQRKEKIIAEGYDYDVIQAIVDKKLGGTVSTPTIKEGSKVKVKNGSTDIYGTKLAGFVYNTVYDVIDMKNEDYVVIGIDGVVTAVVKLSDLYLV